MDELMLAWARWENGELNVSADERVERCGSNFRVANLGSACRTSTVKTLPPSWGPQPVSFAERRQDRRST